MLCDVACWYGGKRTGAHGGGGRADEARRVGHDADDARLVAAERLEQRGAGDARGDAHDEFARQRALVLGKHDAHVLRLGGHEEDVGLLADLRAWLRVSVAAVGGDAMELGRGTFESGRWGFAPGLVHTRTQT